MKRLRTRSGQSPEPPISRETGDALFSEELLELTRRLSLMPRVLTPEELAGEHRSRRRGASPEFADFKAYSQGDDFRRIDWNIYGRLDALFVRLSEITTEIPVHLLLDASSSMLWTGSPTRPQKFRIARQITGLLGFLALQRAERVTISPFADHWLPPFGPSQGRAAVTPMLAYLTGLRGGGETTLPLMLERYGRERKRAGFAMLVSDLLSGEPPDLAAGLRSLRSRGWEIAILHLLDPAEREPGLFAETIAERGAIDLVDLESHERLRLALSDEVIQHCRDATNAWVEQIETICRQENVLRVEIDTGQPLTETLRRLHDLGVLG